MNCQKGIDLWNKAKKLIPGGSQLLSKRSEMFLPDQWPSYYKKAKGVEIWDLDNNKFIDMTIMGVGACTLGYSDKDVDNAVINAINQGTMSTLNCPEEIELTELLIELHPWAEAARFARTGGEMMTIAVRIARAFTKRDKIAFCGYHGWHDWYLSSNLADNANLDGHLLPGLDPNGVPRGLLKTTLPFEYNKIEQLEAIVQENEIGAIVVEPLRHQKPKNDFLERVREISNEIGAVLIFDEITSGWRLTVGGAHLTFNVNPDMMVVGKAMSNGYPMAAVIGKGNIMDAAQTSFISSTYWTERIGPTAALATIRKMQSKNVPAHLSYIGGMISEGWEKLANNNSLNIEILPPKALATFTFNYDNAQEIKTLFTQEMLKKGYLASSSVYVSYSHTKEIVEDYLKAVDEVFKILSQGIKENKISDLLDGPVAHSGFQRLT
ncbi:MAG: aminotransferase class III-fold pyridoxal phosphate-dependent enzyme [Candidatus Lokiarchaeia archaeon]